MAIMLAAFKAAGALEEDAQAAAEELADYENRLNSIDGRLSRVESWLDAIEDRLTTFSANVNARFALPTWTIGVNIAATIAILGVLLRR